MFPKQQLFSFSTVLSCCDRILFNAADSALAFQLMHSNLLGRILTCLKQEKGKMNKLLPAWVAF